MRCMNYRAPVRHLLTLLACACLAAPALAQDDLSAKRAAAVRYSKAVPTAQMMEDVLAELGKQLPPADAEAFIGTMRKLISVDRIESIAIEAMTRTFTLEEINALADFYSSTHGASAMKKFGSYLQVTMPALMQEIQRAAAAAGLRLKP